KRDVFYLTCSSRNDQNANPVNEKFLIHKTFSLLWLFFVMNLIYNQMEIILYIVLGLIIGVVIGRYLLRKVFRKQEIAVQNKAKKILKEAEQDAEHLKKNRLLEAKEKYLQLKSEHEKEISQRNNTLNQRENNLRQKEQSANQRLEKINREAQELENQKRNLDRLVELNQKRQGEVETLKNQQIKQLESIAGLSAEDARNQLVDNLREEARTKALSQIKDIVAEAKLTASKEAKKIVIQTIQRQASESAIENTVSIFHIESDEIKGRIIGREGRNIRA